MEPTESRPARRRLPEQELVAALRLHLAIDEVVGHRGIDTLLAYRRDINSPKRNAARNLLVLDGPADGQTAQQVAEITGHRGDTAKLYLEMRDAFRSTEPDIY